jgi:predicted regulator of Ras-like GTPase activity (Roadblock/LC7/MglB family)
VTKNKRNAENIALDTEPAVTVAATPENKTKAVLEEIQNYNGVVGFILRTSNSAAIDLKDPKKIIDYALLSSSAIDVGTEFSELFDLGDPINIVVEGKNVKILSLQIDEDRISIFMENGADIEKILKRLHGS